MIFHFKNPFTENCERKTGIVQPEALASGQLTSFKSISSNDSAELFGVTFWPYALSVILKIPAYELTNRSINLSDIQSEYKDIYDKVAHGKTDFDRKTIIEEYLKKEISDTNLKGFNLASEVYHQIQNATNPFQLSLLAKNYQISNRQLERIFRNNIGISLREYQKISKFNRALQHFSSDLSLTEIAYDSGYFDQAHFIRSFKTFTGYSPGKYRKKLFNNG